MGFYCFFVFILDRTEHQPRFEYETLVFDLFDINSDILYYTVDK